MHDLTGFGIALLQGVFALLCSSLSRVERALPRHRLTIPRVGVRNTSTIMEWNGMVLGAFASYDTPLRNRIADAMNRQDDRYDFRSVACDLLSSSFHVPAFKMRGQDVLVKDATPHMMLP